MAKQPEVARNIYVVLFIISSGFFIRNQIPGGVSPHSDGGGNENATVYKIDGVTESKVLGTGYNQFFLTLTKDFSI